ncbi:MAG: hypothetical protein VX346_12800 [Planctomycetota bacterium]|nr:hypothetical protein [Planctomycetota bacterium]
MNTLLLLSALAITSDIQRPTIVVVVGAPGTPAYGEQFETWTERWTQIAERAKAELLVVGQSPASEVTDRDQLQQILATHVPLPGEPLWLILIGHGTYDGQDARFNTRGPDFTAVELGEWLQPSQRPLVVINCTSASGPFLARLSGPNRVIVTATRSGFEQNFARFGDYFSRALLEAKADLDKNGQISVLEAYLSAAAGVREFYAEDARLETEHPLLDDNGDARGTPPDWYQGIRATKQPKAGSTADGTVANQRHLIRSVAEASLSSKERDQRNQWLAAIEALRLQKSQLPEEAYYSQLEQYLLKLAQLYASKPASP